MPLGAPTLTKLERQWCCWGHVPLFSSEPLSFWGGKQTTRLQILLVAGSSVRNTKQNLCWSPRMPVGSLLLWVEGQGLASSVLYKLSDWIGMHGWAAQASAVHLPSVPRHVAVPLNEPLEENGIHTQCCLTDPSIYHKTFLLHLEYNVALTFVLIFLRCLETGSDRIWSKPGLSELSGLLINILPFCSSGGPFLSHSYGD